MTMNHSRKTAALGLALLLGAGTAGIAGAHGMMGGGMHGDAQGQGHGSMMHNSPMMGGRGGGMQGMMGGGQGPMMGGMRGMHDGGMGMMQGSGMGMSGPGMQGSMGMMGGLKLDSEQQAQLRELRSEYRREQFARMADMLDLRDEMHALMAEQRPDPEAVRELHGRMADLRGDMMADRIRMRNDIEDMLTDEQRQRMREYRREGRSMPGGQGMPGDGGHRGQQQGHHGSQNR